MLCPGKGAFNTQELEQCFFDLLDDDTKNNREELTEQFWAMKQPAEELSKRWKTQLENETVKATQSS